MIIYDLGKHGYDHDEIEDRRGRGRGRGRTVMEYGEYGDHRFLPPHDLHEGLHERMKELEEREEELEERERELEERERRHEHEDKEYRRVGFTSYYGDDRYYGDGPQMRRGRRRRYY